MWYTSTDGNVVTPNNTSVFGVNLVSNTYENGKGIIKFDGPITTIGNTAFYNCSSLTSITIPDSVTEIGSYAFYNCSSLKAFYGKFASADNRCLIFDGVLKAFAIGCGATSYTIPDSVTEIGKAAFSACSSLKAFYGKFASSDNRCLIVEGVLNTFAIGCGATSYTIPDSVTEIGMFAFSNCISLTSVYCKPTTPPIMASFSFFTSEGKIYVPEKSLNAYKTADGWKDYADAIVGYNF